MRFAKLDRRIRVKRYGSTRDAYGQQVPDLGNLDPDDNKIGLVWAEWIPKGSGKERREAFQNFPDRAGSFVIRYPPSTWTVTESDRIEYDGDTYEITNVAEIGRRDGLRITVTLAK